MNMPPSIRTLMASGTPASELAYALLEATRVKPRKAKGKKKTPAQIQADKEEERRKAHKALVSTLKAGRPELHKHLSAHPDVIAAGAKHTDPKKAVAAQNEEMVKLSKSKKYRDWKAPEKVKREKRIHTKEEVAAMSDVQALRAGREGFSSPHLAKRLADMNVKRETSAKSDEHTKAVAAFSALKDHPSKDVQDALAAHAAKKISTADAITRVQHHVAKHAEAVVKDAVTKAKAPPVDHVAGAMSDADKQIKAGRHAYMVRRFAEYGVHSADGGANLEHMWHVHPVALQAYHHFMRTGDHATFNKVTDQFTKDPGYKGSPVERVPGEVPHAAAATPAPSASTGADLHRDVAKKAFAKIGIPEPTKSPVHGPAYAKFVASAKHTPAGQTKARAEFDQHIAKHAAAAGTTPPVGPAKHTPAQAKSRVRSFLHKITFGLVKESLDEGAKLNTLKYMVMHPSMITHPEVLRAVHHIHTYMDTLAPEDRKQVKIHKPEEGDQKTTVSGPDRLMRYMGQHMEKAGMRANHQKSYVHDVDDFGSAKGDVEKSHNFLHVFHFTDQEESEGKHLKNLPKEKVKVNHRPWRPVSGRLATPEEDAKAWAIHNGIKSAVNAHNARAKAEWQAEEEHHETNRKRVKKGLSPIPAPAAGHTYLHHKAKMMRHFQNQVRAKYGLKPRPEPGTGRHPGMEGW